MKQVAAAAAMRSALIGRLLIAYPELQRGSLERFSLESLLKMAERRGIDTSWWRR